MKYVANNGKDLTKRLQRKSAERRTPSNLIRHIFNKRINQKLKFRLILKVITHPLFIAFCVLIYLTGLFIWDSRKDVSWKTFDGLFYVVSAGWIIFILEPFLYKIALNKFNGNFALLLKGINYFLVATYFILYFSKNKCF
jgi:hypothetical protein